MIVDLVRVQTPDGCLLDGALQLATPADNPPLDAVVLVHGTGSNFYQSTLLETLSDMFCSRGIAALRVNTRGHDGISTLVTGKGGIRAGAAYEAVDECRHDLAAWSAFARQRVGPRVAFVGHSLGAVKCLYAAVHEEAIEPTAVIAVSPPRLSYSWFCETARRDEFLATFQKSEDMVSRGEGNALMETVMPLPMVISANGYIEKYGPDEKINFLPLLSRLPCPSLFIFGSIELETNVAFQELTEEIVSSTAATKRDIGIVAGADHFYTGKRAELAALIGERLELLTR